MPAVLQLRPDPAWCSTILAQLSAFECEFGQGTTSPGDRTRQTDVHDSGYIRRCVESLKGRAREVLLTLSLNDLALLPSVSDRRKQAMPGGCVEP
jgi:hypothetical protein